MWALDHLLTGKGRDIVALMMRPTCTTFRMIVLGLGCLALLVGCSDDDEPTPPDAKTADAALEAGADTGPKPDPGPIPDLGPPSQFCGVLKEASGVLITSADVLVCNENECHTDTSSSTGTLCFAAIT